MYVVGTHLNSHNKSRLFKRVPTTFINKSENNIAKASFNTLLMKPSADLSLKIALIRLIFYYKFVQ